MTRAYEKYIVEPDAGPVNKPRAYEKYIVEKGPDPTWTDRGKELLQGVGGGLANIPDLASNYVAAPVTFLGSKYAKGQGKVVKFYRRRKFG
jgi:hypothetical protein